MISLPQLGKYEAEPWKIPFVERMRQFYEIVRQGKKTAVMLYRKEDTSTFRYRCYNVVQSLEQSTKWGAVYFFQPEYEKVAEIFPQTDLLIMSRVKWTIPLEWLAARAKQEGVPVLFDVDDCVFDLDMLSTLTNTLAVDLDHEVAYDFWFADVARIQQAASLAQGFTTTNPYLGERLKKKFGYDYQVVPNSLNVEQQKVSEKLCAQKKVALSCRPFTIGYFSGTPSHINDFLEIHKELIRLLNKYPDICLNVVGFMEFPPEMHSLIEENRIVFTPLVDFIELQRLMAQVDVSIVPLVNNTFTNCKSELKFFEAAVVNTITVATPTYTYANAVRNGETGFLCRPGEWYSVLEKIYLGEVDAKSICDKARMEVLSRYCGPNFLLQIEDAYDFFLQKSKEGRL